MEKEAERFPPPLFPDVQEIISLYRLERFCIVEKNNVFSSGNQAETMSAITVTPIGILHCGLKSRSETPRNYDVSEHRGIIEIYPQFRAALDVVLFWLDRADRSVRKVHPRGDTSRPKRGVFSTRSPVRPNPIAISELLVEKIESLMLTVKGIDILDNTPVIDIKSSFGAGDSKQPKD